MVEGGRKRGERNGGGGRKREEINGGGRKKEGQKTCQNCRTTDCKVKLAALILQLYSVVWNRRGSVAGCFDLLRIYIRSIVVCS